MADNVMELADFLHKCKLRESAKTKSYSKYGNTRTEVDGRWFDSKKEAKAYRQLKLLQRGGQVEEFKCQVPFAIEHNGVKICTYRADFVVKWSDGREEVWDVKGFRTKEYELKKKMLKAFYGIDIVEL